MKMHISSSGFIFVNIVFKCGYPDFNRFIRMLVSLLQDNPWYNDPPDRSLINRTYMHIWMGEPYTDVYYGILFSNYTRSFMIIFVIHLYESLCKDE